MISEPLWFWTHDTLMTRHSHAQFLSDYTLKPPFPVRRRWISLTYLLELLCHTPHAHPTLHWLQQKGFLVIPMNIYCWNEINSLGGKSGSGLGTETCKVLWTTAPMADWLSRSCRERSYWNSRCSGGGGHAPALGVVGWAPGRKGRYFGFGLLHPPPSPPPPPTCSRQLPKFAGQRHHVQHARHLEKGVQTGSVIKTQPASIQCENNSKVFIHIYFEVLKLAMQEMHEVGLWQWCFTKV